MKLASPAAATMAAARDAAAVASNTRGAVGGAARQQGVGKGGAGPGGKGGGGSGKDYQAFVKPAFVPGLPKGWKAVSRSCSLSFACPLSLAVLHALSLSRLSPSRSVSDAFFFFAFSLAFRTPLGHFPLPPNTHNPTLPCIHALSVSRSSVLFPAFPRSSAVTSHVLVSFDLFFLAGVG